LVMFPGLAASFVGPAWSLAVEAQFYAAWHSLSDRARVSPLPAAALILAGSVAAFGPRITYYTIPGAVLPLMIGARLAQRNPQVPTWSVWPALAALAAGLAFATQETTLGMLVWVPATSVASAVLVTQLTEGGGVLRWALSSRVATWIGSRSYSLYLWHYLVLEVVSHHGPLGTRHWWASWVVAFGCAEGSYRVVEVPARRALMKLRFTRWTARRAA